MSRSESSNLLHTGEVDTADAAVKWASPAQIPALFQRKSARKPRVRIWQETVQTCNRLSSPTSLLRYPLILSSVGGSPPATPQGLQSPAGLPPRRNTVVVL